MIKDTVKHATFAVFSQVCIEYRAPIQAPGIGRIIIEKECRETSWVNGKDRPREPVLQTTMEVKQPIFRINACEFFAWSQKLGVSVGSELRFSSGGSLLFRNREDRGQLAMYQPSRPAQERSTKFRDRLTGKCDDALLVCELQDHKSESSYHVSVDVI